MRTRWQKMLPQRHLFQRLAVGGQDFILKLPVQFRSTGEADVPAAFAGAVAGHGHEEPPVPCMMRTPRTAKQSLRVTEGWRGRCLGVGGVDLHINLHIVGLIHHRA